MMAGITVLNYMRDLSDEAVCDRWVENPYFQFFCGEEFSSTGWRSTARHSRAGAAAGEPRGRHKDRGDEAFRPRSLVIDTTVQPKAVMFPTDAKLMNRAREIMVRLAKRHGVELRQSYARVGEHPLIRHQRLRRPSTYCAGRYAEFISAPTAKTFMRRCITYLPTQVGTSFSATSLIRRMTAR
jgi:transposase, IS5 family